MPGKRAQRLEVETDGGWMDLPCVASLFPRGYVDAKCGRRRSAQVGERPRCRRTQQAPLGRDGYYLVRCVGPEFEQLSQHEVRRQLDRPKGALGVAWS